MGKGRAPCCDKSKVKKGPWSPAEDTRLVLYIQKHGHSNWRAVPRQAGLMRCGKSCRLRWINYLRPDVKRGNFTPEEEQIILDLHKALGNKWSKIASYLPGRTDNEIKNVWNTHIKKKLNGTTDSVSSHSNSHVTDSQVTSSTLTSNVETAIHELGFAESGMQKREILDGKQTNPGDRCFMSDSPTSSYTSNFCPNEGLQETAPAMNPNNGGFTSSESDEKIEIPFEPDVDYWQLLDTVDEAHQIAGGNQGSTDYFGETHEIGNDDYRQWLRLLENELGLTTTTADVPGVHAMYQTSTATSTPVPDLDPGLIPEWNGYALWQPCPPSDNVM